MFGSLGLPELMLIMFVALIVFGPRRLPEIGRTLGKALGEFKKATDELKNTIEREVRVEELKQITPANLMASPQSVSRSEPLPVTPVTIVEAEPAPVTGFEHPNELDRRPRIIDGPAADVPRVE
jgi:TatA/E family protein of Tat protein translocase